MGLRRLPVTKQCRLPPSAFRPHPPPLPRVPARRKLKTVWHGVAGGENQNELKATATDHATVGNVREGGRHSVDVEWRHGVGI